MAVISNQYYDVIGKILTWVKQKYPPAQSVSEIYKNKYVEAANILQRTRHYHAQAYREEKSKIIFHMKDDECWALLTAIDDIESAGDLDASKVDYSELKKYISDLRNT